MEKARSLFTGKMAPDLQFFAEVVLLETLVAKGESEKIQQQLERVKSLQKQNHDLCRKLDAEMAVGQALASQHHWPEARARLQAAVALAGKHSFHLDRLRVQQLLGRLMLENGELQPGQKLLTSVKQEAQERGIPLLARLASSPDIKPY